MAVYDNSRYIHSNVYNRESVTLLGIRERYPISTENATYYTIKQGDRLDTLAHIYLGDSALLWAILDVNPKYQSELDIKVGDTICIPDLEEVSKYIE